MRACILDINVYLSKDFNSKFRLFDELFPNIFTKEIFRCKLKDFTGFVKRKAACIGDKRKLYIEKYGREQWASLDAEDKKKHSKNCTICKPERNLFTEPKGFRTKKNKKQTPVKCTPNKTSRRDVVKMNEVDTETGRNWDRYNNSLKFVDVLRKNKTLNLTPRKSKSTKKKEKRHVQKKVM